MDDKDSWWQGMIDIQTEATKRACAEVNRLRKENAELRRQIAAFPSDATELQDRVTMLEARALTRPTLAELSDRLGGWPVDEVSGKA